MKNIKRILSFLLILLVLMTAVKIRNKFTKVEGMDEVEEILNRAIENEERRKNEVNQEIDQIEEIEDVKEEEKTEVLDEVKNIAKGKKSKATIIAAGDIMYHMPQVKAGYDSKTKTYNFDDNYSYIRSYIEDADVSIVNLETAVAGNELGFSGYPSFNSPVEILDSIKNAGFTTINYSNNHVLDKGKSGLLKSIGHIKERGFDIIGATDGDNEKFLIKEVDGIKLGFLSYSYGFNGNEARYSKLELDSVVNKINDEKIRDDIEYLKSQKVDFIITYLHWGVEYSKEVSKAQKLLANSIFTAGGDIILGSHPHVVQGYDGSEDKNYVIYSMGNFISNQRKESLRNANTEDGLMVRLELSKDEYGVKKIENVKHIPTWVNKYYGKNKYNYEIIPVEDGLSGNLEIENFKSIENELKKSLDRTNAKLKNKVKIQN